MIKGSRVSIKQELQIIYLSFDFFHFLIVQQLKIFGIIGQFQLIYEYDHVNHKCNISFFYLSQYMALIKLNFMELLALLNGS